LIYFSVVAIGVDAQQALMNSIATDALHADFNYEKVYQLDTMFGAASAEIVQIYSPHLLVEGGVLVYGNSDATYGSDTLQPISV